MQNQSYLTEMSTRERLAVLEDTADKVEQTKYLRSLSPDELDVKREQLTEDAIKLSDLKQELKDITAGFKDRMKPIEDELSRLIGEVKTKQELCEGRVYHMANHDNGMMESYDQTGELIGTRRLRPDEKQANLFVAQ